MYCARCGILAEAGDEFCAQCGERLAAGTEHRIARGTKPKAIRKSMVLIIVLCAVVVGGIAYYAGSWWAQRSAKRAAQQPVAGEPTVINKELEAPPKSDAGKEGSQAPSPTVEPAAPPIVSGSGQSSSPVPQPQKPTASRPLPPSSSTPPAAPGGRPDTATQTPPIDQRTVWTPTGTLDPCRAAGPPCLETAMRQSGAPAQAMAFARALKFEGYLSELEPTGRVAMGIVTYPFRVNDNDEPVLLNGSPPVINVWSEGRKTDLRGTQTYASIKQRAPDTSYADDPPRLVNTNSLNGGQTFTFLFEIKRCHACSPDGSAQVAFDFDTNGRYRGTRLVRVDTAAKEGPRSQSPPMESGVWYYCQSAHAFYPNIQTCPEAWVKVPAGAPK